MLRWWKDRSYALNEFRPCVLSLMYENIYFICQRIQSISSRSHDRAYWWSLCKPYLLCSSHQSKQSAKLECCSWLLAKSSQCQSQQAAICPYVGWLNTSVKSQYHFLDEKISVSQLPIHKGRQLDSLSVLLSGANMHWMRSSLVNKLSTKFQKSTRFGLAPLFQPKDHSI